MREDSNLVAPSSVPAHIQQIASDLRLIGRVGFWMQLVLGVISTVVLSFGTLILLSNSQRTSGIEVGILAAVGGVGFLGVSIYFSRRYIQFSKNILSVNPNDRPKKSDTLQLVKTGIVLNLIGMLLTIVGAEALAGIVLQKILLTPQATVTANASQFINSADVLIIQANTNSIAAHFTGLASSLWLINRLTEKN